MDVRTFMHVHIYVRVCIYVSIRLKLLCKRAMYTYVCFDLAQKSYFLLVVSSFILLFVDVLRFSFICTHFLNLYRNDFFFTHSLSCAWEK